MHVNYTLSFRALCSESYVSYLPIPYKSLGTKIVSIFSTYHVLADHTAENIGAELIKIAGEWGISDKICCIITDSASNMVIAVRIYKMETYSLLCPYSYFMN